MDTVARFRIGDRIDGRAVLADCFTVCTLPIQCLLLHVQVTKPLLQLESQGKLWRVARASFLMERSLTFGSISGR